MTAAHVHHPDLTRNQSLVYDVLNGSDAPLSAYSILDALRGEGFRAPLQVYRALEKLRAYGLVHRLESLNAFVACSHPDCAGHETAGFAICEKCGKVSEFAEERIAAPIRDWAKAEGFVLAGSTIELRGLCRDCREG
ncbi:Fur family transcriptional regulator [Stappia indica]|uniref:Fur family transcriptional regulator n=1 Tax=Stappia indica TaxID=538381 RepID=UPI001CD5ED73|nr:Fur family transcriptional regulator [Stappia indica]MCA1300132.1 transcriptional repressor [Stappia indica]